MTVLSAVQNASLKIGVERPSVLYAGTTRELVELQALANECAQMIAFDSGHDWTALKTLGTFTGDGSDLSFSLPPDYKRMLKKAALWPSSTPYSAFTHVADTDDWLGFLSQGYAPLIGAWTIIGEEVHIREGGPTSPLASGNVVSFYYLTNKCCKDSGGTAKVAFTADDDTYRLDERLLTLAMIYKWKQDKEQDYTEALSDYGNALFERIGSDKGSNIFSVGKRRSSSFDAGMAYPRSLVP